MKKKTKVDKRTIITGTTPAQEPWFFFVYIYLKYTPSCVFSAHEEKYVWCRLWLNLNFKPKEKKET